MAEEVLETTEGESVDLYDKLFELVGWKVVDKDKETDLTLIRESPTIYKTRSWFIC